MLVSILLSACAPAATPTDVPLNVVPTAMPAVSVNADAIAGTWSGTLKNGDVNLQITETIGQACAIGSVCGQFDIPSIPCSGTWTLMDVSGTTYQWQPGSYKGKCAGDSAGSESLELLPDGTILATSTGSYGVEQGVLQRVIAQAPNPRLVEFKLPTSASEPGGIVAGPDGALWFVETAVNKIGRISTDGIVTEYPVPTAKAIDTDQGFIAVGPDGALWFNEDLANQIGRITASGQVTEYKLPDEFKPTREQDSPIRGIVTGPDGALWLTSSAVNAIVKLTMDGKMAAKYVLPKAGSGPVGMVVGPDGALWFVEKGANQIGRITLDGKLSEYALPDSNSGALRITAGADKAMWFTMIGVNKIGRISTDGTITTFDVADMGPVGITSGADGALWFTGYGSTEIGRMTTDGVLTKIQVPTTASVPYHITAGPDGNLWFTEQQGNKIGQIQLPAPTAAQGQTTFSSKIYKLHMSMSLNPEWSVSDQYADLVTLEGPAELGFIIVTDTTEIADTQPPFSWMPFPNDFVTWVKSDALFQIVKIQPVVIGGFSGTQMDASGTTACNDPEGHNPGKRDWILLQGTGWNCRPDEHWQFIYLDNVNGKRLLIINSGGPATAEQFNLGLEESQKVFDSIIFTK
jgi:virginiamycin B lyase